MSYRADTNRYNSMSYRRCGKSGLMLPLVSLGLWQNFGRNNDFQQSRSMILRAFDLGITHFDLANNYGTPYGSAEETFGKIIKNDLRRYRDELIISTKAGWDMWPGPYGDWGSRKYLITSLDQSLVRLNLDYVDIFYHHRPDPETPLYETMSALDYIFRSGKAIYVGVSSYSKEETLQASKVLNKLGTPCLINQVSYNIIDRWIEDGLTTILEKEGIGCIAFSVLAQGILSDKYLKGIPPDSRAAKPHSTLSPDELDQSTLGKIRILNNIANGRGQTLAQMAIAWVLQNKVMTSALVGASNLSQIEENVSVINNLKFSDSELKLIDAALMGLKNQL